MTAVPPPVPPEIVQKAAKALTAPRMVVNDTRARAKQDVETVLAAVYGDIVEAARRDALLDARIAVAALDPFDEGNGWGAAIEAATEAVADLANRPAAALSATVSDQQPESAPAPVRDTEGPQKRSQPFAAWVLQAMDDHQQQAEARMRRLLDEEPTDD